MKMKKAVIGIESLVDPLNLSIALAYLLKVKGIKIVVSNIDYLYLQSMHGGDLPDDDGVFSIDSVINYAWEQIERNNKLHILKRATDEKLPIISSKASLSMIYNLSERGYIELVDERFGSIADGLCFLLTKDVDKGDPYPSHYFSKIANKNGLLGDVFRWDTLEEILTPEFDPQKDDFKFLKEKYPHLPPSLIKPVLSRFYGLRSYLLWSRYQTVGISARQNIPIVNSDKFFQERLQKCIGRKYPQINKEVHTAKENVDINFRNYAVRDFIGLIDRSDNQVRFVDALYKVDEQFRKQKEDKEDLIIFMLNLGFGLVPFLGTGITAITYLYKKIKRFFVFQ